MEWLFFWNTGYIICDHTRSQLMLVKSHLLSVGYLNSPWLLVKSLCLLLNSSPVAKICQGALAELGTGADSREGSLRPGWGSKYYHNSSSPIPIIVLSIRSIIIHIKWLGTLKYSCFPLFQFVWERLVWASDSYTIFVWYWYPPAIKARREIPVNWLLNGKIIDLNCWGVPSGKLT